MRGAGAAKTLGDGILTGPRAEEAAFGRVGGPNARGAGSDGVAHGGARNRNPTSRSVPEENLLRPAESHSVACAGRDGSAPAVPGNAEGAGRSEAARDAILMDSGAGAWPADGQSTAAGGECPAPTPGAVGVAIRLGLGDDGKKAGAVRGLRDAAADDGLRDRATTRRKPAPRTLDDADHGWRTVDPSARAHPVTPTGVMRLRRDRLRPGDDHRVLGERRSRGAAFRTPARAVPVRVRRDPGSRRWTRRREGNRPGIRSWLSCSGAARCIPVRRR